MINELEKHLADEYKKLEQIHFKKDENLKMSNSLQTRKTVSPVKRTNKNYVHYKEKKISSDWSNSLRNQLYSRGSILDQKPSTKDNIRSSISKILNLRELEFYPSKVKKTSSMSLPCHNDIMSTKSYEQPNDSAQNIQSSPLPLEKQVKHLIFNFKKFH